MSIIESQKMICQEKKLRNPLMWSPLYVGHAFVRNRKFFMPRPGITGADVVRAYVALQKQRRAPTIVNLRLELGKGSYSTIAERLEALALIGRGGRYARNGPPRARGRPARIDLREAETEN